MPKRKRRRPTDEETISSAPVVSFGVLHNRRRKKLSAKPEPEPDQSSRVHHVLSLIERWIVIIAAVNAWREDEVLAYRLVSNIYTPF